MSLNINKLYKGLSGFGAPLLKQEYFCCYCLWTINHDRAAPQPLDKLLIYESLYLFSNLTTLLSCLFSCMTRLSQWQVSRGGVSHFQAEGGRDSSCFFPNLSLQHKRSPNPYEVAYQPGFCNQDTEDLTVSGSVNRRATWPRKLCRAIMCTVTAAK